MNPFYPAPKLIKLAFLSNAVPTDLQAAQLASHFHANPQALINNFRQYAGHEGKVQWYQFIGRHHRVRRAVAVHYGVALLSAELAYPWSPYSDLGAIREVVRNVHEGTATRACRDLRLTDPPMAQVGAQAQAIKQAVLEVQASAPGIASSPPVTSMYVFHGKLPLEAEYVHNCVAVIFRSARMA